MASRCPLKFEKYVYDSIHGNIGITEHERTIIDTSVFQRLHRIKNLGPADLVYPGATSSRFAHSLGTMFVMTQYLENVTQEGNPLAERDEWQKLRLAALLHDVGHYPFSHALEVPIKERMGGDEHEEVGKTIVRSILRENLDCYTPEDIIDIWEGTKVDTPQRMLVSSDVDIDKVDYLQRDSYHTGVGYGLIDVDRLLRTMNFDTEGNIVFEKPGPVIENFLLGRYHMFQAVYYHKTVIAFELMIESVYPLLVQGRVLEDPADLTKSVDEECLTSFTDDQIWQGMCTFQKQLKKEGRIEGLSGDETVFTSSLIRMLFCREPLKLADWVLVSAEKEAFPVEYEKFAQLFLPLMKDYLAEEASKGGEKTVAAEWILPWKPPRPLSLVPEDTPIYVFQNDEKVPLADCKFLIFQKLGRSALYDARVYTKEQFRRQVEAALKEYCKLSMDDIRRIIHQRYQARSGKHGS